MDNKELTIEPFIYYGPGRCPKCCGTLVVADSEISVMELNQDGVPVSYDDTNIRCEAVCLECGNRIEMIRWKSGYIPYSKKRLKRLLMEAKLEVDQRKEKLNEMKKENPFL